MTGTSTARAVAGLVSAMVGPYNTGDVLADLVHDCAELYPAAAVAVMVVDGDLAPRGGARAAADPARPRPVPGRDRVVVADRGLR